MLKGIISVAIAFLFVEIGIASFLSSDQNEINFVKSELIGISPVIEMAMDDSAVCCDINGQPDPPICKTQVYPVYRVYYGVAYLCMA